MLDKINTLLAEINTLTATSSEELEAARIKYLSKKGLISTLMDDFRHVPADQKRETGVKINELKQKAQEKIQSLKEQFENTDSDAADLDLSRTAYPISLGTRHPISIVKEEICDIFKRLGFSIADGPEIEDDWHVFGSLNFARRPPGTRYAGHVFYPKRPANHLAHTHFVGANARDGKNAAAHSHHLSGQGVPQRGDFVSCTLLFSSSGSVVCG